MKDSNLPPTLQMGMRSSVNVSSEVLGALLETPALHALLDSFSEALIVTDGEGRLRFINLAAERVNRLSKQQAVGLSESDFFQLGVELRRFAGSVEPRWQQCVDPLSGRPGAAQQYPRDPHGGLRKTVQDAHPERLRRQPAAAPGFAQYPATGASRPA
jgi:PAS domain-containing protein